MSIDDLGKQLHDKATRGIALSPSEQTQLTAWYAAQDQAESQLLALADAPQRLGVLHSQVETALHQLQTVTQRIQELTVQNEAVRQEITLLQHQLAHLPTSQTA